MTVSELISKLKKLDPNLEVMIDCTQEGDGDGWVLSSIDFCGEATLNEDGEQIALLSNYGLILTAGDNLN